MPSIFSMIVQHQIKNKQRAQNFDFFKACMAAAALVAVADGRADKRESAGLDQLTRTLEQLNIYARGHGTEIYDDFVEQLTENPEKGRRKALGAVEAVKGDPEWASLLIVITASVSEADGTLDESEQETIDQLCALLDIDPGSIEPINLDTKDAVYD